jgi:hypothetical protein
VGTVSGEVYAGAAIVAVVAGGAKAEHADVVVVALARPSRSAARGKRT